MNLNALTFIDQQQDGAGREVLMQLPGMTETIADAIMDWLDDDDEPREFGAEIEYYSALPTPYEPTNGPFESVEQLMLVKGVTPQLLFGSDFNRNMMLDTNEQNAPMATGVDNTQGNMDRGWSAYLTLYSMEKNVDPEGNPRVYLNQTDAQTLHDALTEVLDSDKATFIVAFRQNGRYTNNNPSQPLAGQMPDMSVALQADITSLYALIDEKVQFTDSSQQTIVVDSPWQSANLGSLMLDLPKLMQYCTTTDQEIIPGRVNINQASRVVLEGIPGMQAEWVEAILASRDPDPDQASPTRLHETWLLSEGIVTEISDMEALAPFITAGGDVYRGQIVGYFEDGNTAARAEVFFDATQLLPRVLFWRDISHLGRGFPAASLGVRGG
ncbi:MAG: general secretion pathway protein GspK [Planctomycetales bacterium]|nr:general secretion pathway protein GspK [Planctomycetales bacterium]